MGWFDEQIHQRAEYDDACLSEAFACMSAAVMGKMAVKFSSKDKNMAVKTALEEILAYYRIKPEPLHADFYKTDNTLEFLLRPYGIMCRNVNLTGSWYKDGFGPMLGTTKDEEIVALIPGKFGGYEYFSKLNGRKIKVNKSTSLLIKDEGICFYKPLPSKPIGAKDIFSYMAKSLNLCDVLFLFLTFILATLVSMIFPFINSFIFDNVIVSASTKLLSTVAITAAGVMLSHTLIDIAKLLTVSRIKLKTEIPLQAAINSRLYSLPAKFFKKYSAGELAERVQGINDLCSILSDTLMTSGLSLIFSFAYIYQITLYAETLVLPAVLTLLSSAIFTILITFIRMKLTLNKMEYDSKQSGIIYSLFYGIQKIKLAGAENRAFSKWAQVYAKSAKLQYNPPILLKISDAVFMAVNLAGTIAIYYFAASSDVSVADYMAFNVTYGLLAGAFMHLPSLTSGLSYIKPILNMIDPILREQPETASGKKMITELSGNIELCNISFKYDEDMPNVVDNLSLTVAPKQYVALVGETGCGKSTLLRLLLGFEKPQRGSIYYDSSDIETLDLKSLRRLIGVVMQDGKLFQGNIFSNITVGNSNLTMEDAWRAAELAGIADDIKAMPMGMLTMISEGSRTISGGQRQRIMIARAIVSNPKVLMFDEATSALDNITQKHVAKSLDELNCTRIVIAHRLSTIKNCDRIIVLKDGKIFEDGTYDELINLNGYFSSLVKRQQII